MTAPNPYQPAWAQPQPSQQTYHRQQDPQYPGQQQYPQHSQQHPQQYLGQQYPGPPQFGVPQFAGHHYPSGPPTVAGPSAVTARIAAVLALLGVIHMVVLAISALAGELPDDAAEHVDASSFNSANTVQLIAAIVVGLLLTVGGAMMLLRNMIGRWLITAACGLHIIAWILLGVWLHSFLSDAAEEAGVELDGSVAAGMGVGWFFVLIFPFITVVLANVPSTAKWLAAAPGTGHS